MRKETFTRDHWTVWVTNVFANQDYKEGTVIWKSRSQAVPHIWSIDLVLWQDRWGLQILCSSYSASTVLCLSIRNPLWKSQWISESHPCYAIACTAQQKWEKVWTQQRNDRGNDRGTIGDESRWRIPERRIREQEHRSTPGLIHNKRKFSM